MFQSNLAVAWDQGGLQRHKELIAELLGVVALQVHERTLQGDFLMALLKDIVTTRRAQGNPLKVNATFNAACQYLETGTRTSNSKLCPG